MDLNRFMGREWVRKVERQRCSNTSFPFACTDCVYVCRPKEVNQMEAMDKRKKFDSINVGIADLGTILPLKMKEVKAVMG